MQLTETELKGLCSLKSISQPNGVSRAPVGVSTQVCMFYNFLSISPNQTKFLPYVRLVPGPDFSAILVSISAVSLGRLSSYSLFRF